MAKAKEQVVANLSVDVLGLNGKKVETLTLTKDVFGVEVNSQVMFDAIQVYQSNKRQATAKVKRKFEVAGSGMKPWRQKGTGRARAGSKRSVIWVGGGKYKGPDGKQNWKISQNRSQYRLAIKSALTQKLSASQIVVVDQFTLSAPKTKLALEALAAVKANLNKTLLVVDQWNETLERATRNIEGLTVVLSNQVNVFDLVNNPVVVFTKPSVLALQEALVNG
jgi:large subunit ribosomal protein L4